VRTDGRDLPFSIWERALAEMPSRREDLAQAQVVADADLAQALADPVGPLIKQLLSELGVV